MSLQDCIRKANKALDRKDADAITAAAQEKMAQGMDQDAAEREAVLEHLGRADAALEDLAGQAEKAGAKVARVEGALPMDTESRMARAKEQGFDTDLRLVHVNRGGIVGDGFDDSMLPSMDPDAPFNAHWFTTQPSPQTAFRGGVDGDTYTPVFLNRTGLASIEDVRAAQKEVFSKGGSANDVRELLKERGFTHAIWRGRESIDADELEKTGRTEFKHSRGKTYSLVWETYKHNGKEYPTLSLYDGNEHITGYENLQDFEESYPMIEDVAVFDASAIRSINAAFDPNETESSMILAQSPETEVAEDKRWANYQPPKTKTGKYKGSPPGVNTPAKLSAMRRKLKQLIQEGQAGRYWYEESARQIMAVVRNNPVDAEKLVQLIAIYSPQATVQVNTGFAVKAWNQWKNGIPREDFWVATGTQNDKAIALLYDGKPFTGRKTDSFYMNLMHQIVSDNPEVLNQLSLDRDIVEELNKPVTIDLWMFRAFGYPSDSGSDDMGAGKYSFSENEIRRLTAELNQAEPNAPRWLPHQVQAAIWSAMKARYENPAVKSDTWEESIKKGYATIDEKGDRKLPKANSDEERKHQAIWRKRAMAVPSEEVPAAVERTRASFDDYLRQMTEVVTWEAIPSDKLGLAINSASDEVRQRFTEEAVGLIVGPNGEDLLASKLGVPLNQIMLSYGAYDQGVNHNALSHLLPTKVAGEWNYDQARAYAKAIQYIYKQDAVPFFRADPQALVSKSAQKDQMFKVVKVVDGEDGRMVPKSRVDTLAEAQEIAAQRGEGYEVRGGTYARGVALTLSEELSGEALQDFEDTLVKYLGEDAGFTKTGANELTILNFRDDNTHVPFVDDEVFLGTIDRFVHEQRAVFGISEAEPFWAEGEYGDIHDWAENPSGNEILERGFARSPDLQAWIRGRRQDFERLLDQYEKTDVRQGIRPEVRPDTGRGNPIPVRADGKAELVHYSFQKGLGVIDPSYYGRGISGAESKRKFKAPDLWVDRSYYGMAVGKPGGYQKEARLGGETYVTSIDPSSLYDFKADPLNLRAQAKEMASGDAVNSAYEMLIKQAGFSGYYVNNPSLGMVAAVFEPLKVESQEVSGETFYQPAYHGTPHTFKKFSLHAIGSGEGAHAYGYGLYFSSKKEIAEYYRDSLSKRRLVSKDTGNEVSYQDIKRAAGNQMLANNPNLTAEQLDMYSAAAVDIHAAGASSAGRNPDVKLAHKYLKDHYEFEGTGKLYTVEIPDESLMLDWDKPLSEQPEAIREAIRANPSVSKRLAQWRDSFGEEKIKGEQIYDAFAQDPSNGMSSQPDLASAQLRELGIPGITYKGGSSGERNFVIWDENLIEIQKMEQDERAYIQISPTRKMHIGLLENADLTSFIHESGHMYLEVMRDNIALLSGKKDLTETQQQVLADGETLLKWLKKDSWDQVTREDHERFAKGWEQYTFEGKAPSVALRAAFARFRSWMLSVYKTIKNAHFGDVKLNNEVREVFDRMLATDAQIAEAKASGISQPVFLDAQAAGMTSAEFKVYRGNLARANAKATQELEQQLIKEWKRETAAWWREESARVRDAVIEELNQRRDYAAQSILRTGKLPNGTEIGNFKLDTGMLQEIYDPEQVRDLINMRVTSVKNGMAPTDVASLVGYSSGDEMVKELLALEPIKKSAQKEAHRRMLEKHGDIRNDGSMAEKATLAVLNDKLGSVIEAEAKALRKLQAANRPALAAQRADQRQKQQAGVSQIRDLPSIKTARERARGMIAQQRYRDIRPNVYLAAVKRAANAAVVAAAKQDYATAAFQKQQQMFNLALYQEASKAKEEADKQVKYLKTMGKKTVAQRLGKTGYLEQIQGILERFDLRNISLKAADKRADLQAFIAEQEDLGLPINLPEEIVNEAYRESYKNLSIEELTGLYDSVKHLDHLSKLKNRLLKVQDKRSFDAFMDDLSGTVLASKGKAKLLDPETSLPQERAKNLGKMFIAMHRKISSIARVFDGNKSGGIAWEGLVRPVSAAMDAEAEMMADTGEKLQEIFSKIVTPGDRLKSAVSRESFGAYKGGMYGREFYPQLKTNRYSGNLSLMGKRMIALNWGNAGNRQRLMDGYGWSEGAVQSVLGTLTREDWQFVQDIWALIDSFWPKIEEMSKRVEGYAPEKIEPVDVATPFGVIEGGYFPASYNSALSKLGLTIDAAEAAKRAMNGATARSTTKHPFREKRAAKVVDAPIDLSDGVIFRHLSDVIHDVTHFEMLIDLNRIVSDSRFTNAVIEAYGPEINTQIRDYVQDVARGNQLAHTAFERVLGHLRSGVSVVGMGWRFTTAAIQYTGISQSIVRVGAPWVTQGLIEFLSNPIAVGKMVNEKSVKMRHRGDTQIREINDVVNTIHGKTGIQRSFFYMIAKMQRHVDIPTWLGEYRHALAQGIAEDKAVAMADQAVTDSQGGGQTGDLSAILRGGPLQKLFTSFYSYFNVTMNLTAESAAKVHGVKDIPAFITDMILLYTVPAVLGMMLREAMTPEDEDDEDPFWKRALLEHLNFMLGTLVVAREVGSAISGYKYGYSGPAGMRFFAEVGKLAQQAAQAEIDKPFIKRANMVAGIIFHYPAGQVEQSVEGAIALIEGETDDWRALLTGPPRD